MSASRAPRSLRTDARRNRDALVAAARAEFTKHGLHVTDERIARSAGVGTATLRRHFRHRGALIDEIYLPRMEAEIELLEQSLQETDWEQVFERFLTECLDRLGDDPTSGDLLVTPMPTAVRVEAAKQRIHRLLAHQITRYQEAGYLRADLTIADITLHALAVMHVAVQTHDIAPNAHRRYAELSADACRATDAPELDTPPMTIEQLHRVLTREGDQRWQRRRLPPTGDPGTTERPSNHAPGNIASRNRQALLLAAKTEFSAVGLRAPLEDIAKRAGVGIGTLYRHFPTRLSLIDALYLRTLEERNAFLDDSLAMPNALEGLRSYIGRSIEQLTDDIAARDLIAADPPPGTRSAHAKELFRAKMTELLGKGQRQGSIRGDFTLGDLVMYGLAFTHVRWETRDCAPDAWRRFNDMLIEALRPERAHELTGPVLTNEQSLELAQHRARTGWSARTHR
ncbi:TetR family transcriptional regulator [Tamaricihabitans halophyticus]|uniref:TetR family transcriptional regulator n=1 Tax=Tamaricihabitans halophyticus TaxID=1262583 RepID=A0A4R2QL05_9PSEU|nr:TetR/AcrR family transcriptional regulator [Tamaricihabitans halophyticus]TCP49198.1 TetR family transcriptional regulator [Tamaricihabitans halophyticus]